MHAAVVTTFGSAPRYQEFPIPVPASGDEMLVDVLAAGLHPRVRSQADGSHYTSTDELPLVPGIDGVGRGPDGTVLMDGAADGSADRLGQLAADVDVVIDYLWGEPTAAAMIALLTNRADRHEPLTWIQIGSVAGPTAPIPSAALRAARLQIVGSGQGSVSAREYLAELPALAEQIAAGRFDVDARAMPLSDVEQAWAAAADVRKRIVLIPQQ